MKLYQPQGAMTGLIICRQDDQTYVLLQARIEPGNIGICQFGPTVQSTPANYLRLHGGKTTPFSAYFLGYVPGAQVLGATQQNDLAWAYHQKTKAHSFIEVETLLPTPEAFIWVDLQSIMAAVNEDQLLNADLRSLLTVFDWAAFEGQSRPAVTLSVSSRDLLAAVTASQNLGQKTVEMIPLTDLADWRREETGLQPNSGSGVSFEMFRVKALTREKAEWNQPLIVTDRIAETVLYIRYTGSGLEVLLSVQHDTGLLNGAAIGATLQLDPDREQLPLRFQADAEVVIRFSQSEEGGRFFQQDSHYTIVSVSGAEQAASDQFWVPLKDVKQLLKISNSMTFQLRAVLSGLLRELNDFA